MGEEKINSVLSGRVSRSDERHTPPAHSAGPWSVSRDGIDKAYPNAVVCAEQGLVARVATKADARLIAAAPTMKEALEQIAGGWISFDVAEDDWHGFVTALQLIARAALGKASAPVDEVEEQVSDAS